MEENINQSDRAFEKNEEGLGSKTASGAFWAGIGRVCQHALRILSITVLARLLTPSAYGLVGMAVVVTGFISIFRSLGTTPAIIQRKELSASFVASVFWANVILGAVTTLVGMFLAPVLGWVYGEPNVTPVMFWLSLNFFFSGFGGVHEALLVRAMDFRRLTIIEMVSGALQLLVAVTMAVMGYGYWSLVGAQLTLSLSSTVMLIAAAGTIPAFSMRWQDLKGTLSFSANLSGFTIINYFGRNADNFLIGRYLGATALGYYQFAYNLMLFPIENISQQLGRVLFPAFSRMQDDNVRFRKAYLSACAVIASISFPLMMGVLCVAGPFVATVLGPNWTPVTPILTVLAPLGLIQSVVVTVGQIYVAKGRTDLLLRTAVISNAVVLPSFVIGLRWGAFGVACAYAISFGLVSYFLFWYAFRLIELRMRDFAAALSWCMLYSLIMTICVTAVRFALETAGIAAPPVVLAWCVATGVAVYAGLILWRKPPILREIIDNGWADKLPGVQWLRQRRVLATATTSRQA